MSSEWEIYEALERGQVRTTREQDERILSAAFEALPQTERRRTLAFWAAAAAALVAVVLGVRGLREREPSPQAPPVVVAAAPGDRATVPPGKDAPDPAAIDMTFNRRTVAAAAVRDPAPPERSVSALIIEPKREQDLLVDRQIRTAEAMGAYRQAIELARQQGRLPRDFDVEVGESLQAHLAPQAESTEIALLRRAWEKAGRPTDPEAFARSLASLGTDIRGLGGEKGELLNLNDVTNGLDDGSAAGFDQRRAAALVRLLAARVEPGPTMIPPAPGTEDYRALPENRFTDPRREPLSTFSIDVDTASYANLRRFLMQGQLPPPAAVRVEEMVNYFAYDYPGPEGEHPFSTSVEVATCPWNPKHRIVRIGLKGREIPQERIPPRNLVFLLDVSGSMKPQDKLPLVKAAMKLLVGTLREEDFVSIVVYASNTRVVLEPTSGADRPTIVAAIDGLSAGGSTNGEGGIRLAYEMARRHFREDAVNRVLLATDGDFNVGETSREGLLALIEREREGGVYLTVLGVGTGNLKDSRVEMLADAGNGNYAYLDSILEAQKVLVREAGGTMITIAKDVKIQIEFNPAKVGAYRQVGYENRALAAADFNDDRKDAGEIGAGHTVTVLYEIAPPGETGGLPLVDPLRYQKPAVDPQTETVEEHSDEILTVKLRYKLPKEDESRLIEAPLADPGKRPLAEASDDLVFASAVASFGMLLRRSESAEGLSYALVKELAQTSVGEDPDGDRKEFLKLVDLADRLSR
jgi:Ca-activated chloride channel family protein